MPGLVIAVGSLFTVVSCSNCRTNWHVCAEAGGSVCVWIVISNNFVLKQGSAYKSMINTNTFQIYFLGLYMGGMFLMCLEVPLFLF